MHLRSSTGGVFFCAVALVACGKKTGDAKAETRTDASAATASPGDATTTPEATPARVIQRVGRNGATLSPVRGDAPELKDVGAAEYPEEGVPPIDPTCAKPWVLVKSDASTAAVVAQALYANPSFKVRDGEPHAPGEIAVELHKQGDTFIVARGHDSGTCMRLAAMVKALTKGAPPETGCGDLPNGLGASTRVRPILPVLPASSDTTSLCARLGACKLAKDPTCQEDPIGACVRSPSSFPTGCALKPTCTEVLDCH